MVDWFSGLFFVSLSADALFLSIEQVAYAVTVSPFSGVVKHEYGALRRADDDSKLSYVLWAVFLL